MKDRVNILDGNTFLISDQGGNIEPSFDFPTGLFSFDTRFISTWVLTLDGERLHPSPSTTPSPTGRGSSWSPANPRTTWTPKYR